MKLIDALVQSAPAIAAIRKDLHAHPELGFEEVYAARRVAEALRVCGVDRVVTGLGKTGVVGIVKNGTSGRAVGLRADLNVIDHDTLAARPPSLVADLPAGGTRLMQSATGYTATIKNGVVIAAEGEIDLDATQHDFPELEDETPPEALAAKPEAAQDDDEPPRPLSTREVIEQARAAAERQAREDQPAGPDVVAFLRARLDEDEAAVMVPSFLNAGLSAGILSSRALAGSSSLSMTLSPLRVVTVTGAISQSKLPSLFAARARVVLATANEHKVRELRQMLAPPSAVILTGAEVAEHFRRLREGGA